MGIGDEVICTGQARRAQLTDPRKVEILDRNGARRHDGLWQWNPRVAGPYEAGDFQQITSGPGCRPYIDRVRSTQQQWVWRDWECPVGELYGVVRDVRTSGCVVIEPTIKFKASPNKLWPHWRAFVELCKDRRVPIVQLCPPRQFALSGVRRIETRTFMEACGELACARAAVLPDGGLHHAAAALGVPAVVINGGFIGRRQTGYALHRHLDTDEPCGMRVKCQHCDKIMRSITPEQVMAELEMILKRETRPETAVA